MPLKDTTRTTKNIATDAVHVTWETQVPMGTRTSPVAVAARLARVRPHGEPPKSARPVIATAVKVAITVICKSWRT